ncbi:MAG: hypothetical protein WAK34_09530 [Rhodoplanes sp.]
MDKLRDEIIETQKARADLLKWKLIILSVLGAVGLGVRFAPYASDPLPIALALIPLVSLYVDVMCYHLSLRITVLGAFLRNCAGDETGSEFGSKLSVLQKYEAFAAKVRMKYKAFDLEDYALTWSTQCVSVAAILLGVFRKKLPIGLIRWDDNSAIIISGIIGLVGARLIYQIVSRKVSDLNTCNLDLQPPSAVQIQSGSRQ